jgi:hypothetical protein
MGIEMSGHDLDVPLMFSGTFLFRLECRTLVAMIISFTPRYLKHKDGGGETKTVFFNYSIRSCYLKLYHS